MHTGRTMFTVVIPTRERCDTLQSTLRTCVTQNYDNLRILISDNASQDKTKSVVDSFQDSRIQYVNTGRRLSMSHNWEFALSHIKDGYVMYLGDDDGLLPGALQELDVLIQDSGAKAVNWMTGTYGWPNNGYPWMSNKLKFPIGQGVEWRNSKKTLSKVLSCRWGYSELPMLYGFFVHYDGLMAARKAGQPFFRSMTPDIYSGVALTGVLDRYLHSYRPYSIYGISHHSTGASFFNTAESKSSFASYIKEENIPFHKKLAFTSSVAILVAECYLQAEEAGVSFGPVGLDLEKVVREAMREASKLRSPAYETTMEALLKTCEMNNLGPALRARLQKHQRGLWDKVKPQVSLLNLVYKVVFDGELNGVKNIYDACLLAKSVIEKRKTGHFFIKERLDFVGYHARRTLDSLLKRNTTKWGY